MFVIGLLGGLALGICIGYVAGLVACGLIKAQVWDYPPSPQQSVAPIQAAYPAVASSVNFHPHVVVPPGYHDLHAILREAKAPTLRVVEREEVWLKSDGSPAAPKK
jgi:hypothetical protein